jgi:mRNA-degrading endonuclease toxin of MazEF toxin-antitoxin module
MPIKYVLSIISGDHINAEPTIVLIARITKQKKLHENRLEVQNNVGANQWNKFLWSQQKNTKKKFQFGNYVLWFPKG